MGSGKGGGALRNGVGEPLRVSRARVSWLMPLAPSEDPDRLASTLLSLARQSLQADELVIGADGPLPSNLDAVLRRSSLPIRLHQQSRNRGIGATLAVVAPRCEGEVILRIDSDDLYEADHTRLMVAALLENPLLGALGCQLLEVRSDKEQRHSARKTPTKHKQVERWLPWRNPLNHQTVAIRREALIKTGGYRDCQSFEDWDLWLRMDECGYKLGNLSIWTVAARVDMEHIRRRHGWRYVIQEALFYKRQIHEGRISILVGITAWTCRMPWRLLPEAVLGWWMSSKIRGLPAIDTTWITKLV